MTANNVVGFSSLLSSRKTTTATTTTALYAFWDKPFHGHGSGEHKKDLDEQWKIQQEILQDRRGHIDKSALKKKYAHGAKGDLSKLGHNGNEKGDGTYFDTYPNVSKNTNTKQQSGNNKIKFFWEK
jgi:hypothetical protein